MLWAHQGAKRACWSVQRGIWHLTESRSVLDHADPMLQKNSMGNKQHCYIWVTNGPPAQKVKNRYHEVHNHKLYNPSLRWTQAKTSPNEVTWNLRASVYLFILFWLSTTAVELKPKGPKSCRVLDAVWLEGRSPMLCQGFCYSCRFTFIASLKYL